MLSMAVLICYKDMITEIMHAPIGVYMSSVTKLATYIGS